HTADYGTHVPHGLDHVPCAGFALGTNHCGALADPAKGLSQVATAADEGDFECVLVDVKLLVSRCQNFALVDEIHAERFQNLGFDEVADPRLGHDGNGYGVHDLLDELGVGHAGNAALGSDIRRDALE